MKCALTLVLCILLSLAALAKDSDTLWTRVGPDKVYSAIPFFSKDDKNILLAGQLNAMVVSAQSGEVLRSIDTVTITKRFDDGTKYLGQRNNLPVLIDASTYERIPINYEVPANIVAYSFDVSPDGQRIFGFPYNIRPLGYAVWSALTGKLIEEVSLEGKTGDTLGSIRWVAHGEFYLGADGNTIIVSCLRQTYDFNGKTADWRSKSDDDMCLRGYDTRDKALIYEVPHIMADEVHHGTLTPDRHHLFVVDYRKNMMVLLNTKDGSLIKEYPELPAMPLTFTDDIAYLSCGGGVGGGMPVYDYKANRLVALYKLNGYTGWSFCAFSHDKRYIAASVGSSIVLFIADWTSDVPTGFGSEVPLRPNPASGIVEINLRVPFVTGRVEIYDAGGKLAFDVPTSLVQSVSSTALIVDVSKLANGSYIVSCTHDGVKEDYKLLISK